MSCAGRDLSHFLCPPGTLLVQIRDPEHDSSFPVKQPSLRVDAEYAQLMKRYVPMAVVPKLEAGLDLHIAVLLDVSVLFINCHGVTLAAGAGGR